VCLHAARRLVEVLPRLSSGDDEVQRDLVALHRRLQYETRWRTPWRVRDHLDVLAILDPPSWSVLLGLIDECPVLPRAAAETKGSRPTRLATEIEFVSSNRQVAWVHDFAASLPERLAGLDAPRAR
jgi:hypothetical protein